MNSPPHLKCMSTLPCSCNASFWLLLSLTLIFHKVV